MKTLELSQGKVALIDAEDYARVAYYRWQAIRQGQNQNLWHASRTEWAGGKTRIHRYLHHEILGHSRRVDHKNGDGLDNRKQNLREATASQNGANMRKPVYVRVTTSRYKGVSWEPSRNRWAAYIRVNRVRIHLGRFSEETDAARAYDTAAKEFFGPFARLNFPENSSCNLVGQPLK